MTDDIVTLLRKYQPYSKLHGQAADEIEHLRSRIDDCDNDFDALRQMFDKMRTDRDNAVSEIDRLREHVRQISIQLDRAMSAQA